MLCSFARRLLRRLPLLRSAAALGVLLLAGSLLAATARPAHAQDADAAERVITFDEAVRLALEQNYRLRLAQNDVEAQSVEVARNRMQFLPDLRTSASGFRNYGRTFSQEQGGIVNTSESARFGVSTSLNLFNGFRDDASLDEAQAQTRAASRTLSRRRQDVVFDVIARYIDLAQNREIVRVQEENLALRREQLQQTEVLIEVGERPPSEVYQQRAAVAEAEGQRLEAERAAEITETELIRLLVLDPLGEYAFSAEAVERVAEAELAPETYALDRLLQQAFDARADLRAQEALINARQQGVRAARAGYYPRLDVSADYGSNWSSLAAQDVPDTGTPPQVITVQDVNGTPQQITVPGTGGLPDSETIPFFDQLDDRRNGTVGLSLSFPIFDRFQTRYNVDQAQVQLDDARFQLEQQRDDLAVEARQALVDYQNAQQALDVAETRLEAAEQAQRAAEERYELGAAPYVELAQANTELVRAASERVRAKYDVLFQKKRIDYVQGVLNPEAPLL